MQANEKLKIEKFILGQLVTDIDGLKNMIVIVPRSFCASIDGKLHVKYDKPPFNEQDIVFINSLTRLEGPPPDAWDFYPCKILNSFGTYTYFYRSKGTN